MNSNPELIVNLITFDSVLEQIREDRMSRIAWSALLKMNIFKTCNPCGYAITVVILFLLVRNTNDWLEECKQFLGSLFKLVANMCKYLASVCITAIHIIMLTGYLHTPLYFPHNLQYIHKCHIKLLIIKCHSFKILYLFNIWCLICRYHTRPTMLLALFINLNLNAYTSVKNSNKIDYIPATHC